MQMDSPVETTVLQPEERIVNTQGILTIANINTTIGYCRYDEPPISPLGARLQRYCKGG